jgi:hypothetical protein
MTRGDLKNLSPGVRAIAQAPDIPCNACMACMGNAAPRIFFKEYFFLKFIT